jgi:hypothetical protein
VFIIQEFFIEGCGLRDPELDDFSKVGIGRLAQQQRRTDNFHLAGMV